MKALTIDHDAVIEDVRNGLTYQEIAKKHGISVSSASRIGRKCGVHRYKGETESWSESDWYQRFCNEWEEIMWICQFRREWAEIMSEARARRKRREERKYADMWRKDV